MALGRQADLLGLPDGADDDPHVAGTRRPVRGRLLDELHLVIAPVFVGEGERLLGGLGVEKDYQVSGFEASEAAVHYRIVKKR